MKRKQRNRLAILEEMLVETGNLGLGALMAEGERTDGRHVRVSGRELINFGSCSYLGLELDARLIEAASEAVRAHGVQFCSSRIFVSSPPYAEFESLLEQIFGLPVVVSATTTLAHLAALPVLIEPEDAILLDHQVHSSVQMASRFVGASGAKIELVPHNNMERLESRVAALSREHRQVWYMADGIYSMFGDRAPMTRLNEMLDRHDRMRLYVDDAHGMSWCGPRGAGSVLETAPLHPRAVLSTGLGKGFGTGGGVLILPDREVRNRIQLCGPTMLFSGPLQPAILGAAIASAKIHLTPEIDRLQSELRERIDFTTGLIRERGLPLVSPPDTPVGFIATGPTAVCRNLCGRMIEEGLYANPAQFPAAPVRQSGLRFLITRHHRFEDLERLVDAVDRHWEAAVLEAGSTPQSVCQRFGLEPRPSAAPSRKSVAEKTSDSLVLEWESSIDKLDAREWDSLLGDRGCLGASALRLFERVFGPDRKGAQDEPENRWEFRYVIVRDEEGAPVLATVLTASLWKADMLAPASVSEEVEALRAQNPLYLTQRVFSQGCLLSEGDHLWLREPAESDASRRAIGMLLDWARDEANRLDCGMLVLRDVRDDDRALEAVYEAQGLLRNPGPESLVLDDVPASDQELVGRLGHDHRRHYRRSVEPWNDAYDVEVVGAGGRALDEQEAGHLHGLYESVRAQSLELNTFALPVSLWQRISTSPDWELVLLRPRGEAEAPVSGFFAAYHGGASYVPLVAGLDYTFVAERGLYRQLLRQTLERARRLGRERILFGFGASLEKRRFGARPVASNMFVELDDHFAVDAIEQISANGK